MDLAPPFPASSKTPPLSGSKHDVFMFKRKNVEAKEYVNAKSVANLDDEEDDKPHE